MSGTIDETKGVPRGGSAHQAHGFNHSPSADEWQRELDAALGSGGTTPPPASAHPAGRTHHAGAATPGHGGIGDAGGSFHAGHAAGTWRAGVGYGTETKVPNAKQARPTLSAPYDPATKVNQLQGDGDIATFNVSINGKVAVPVPDVPVPVGIQAQGGYTVTLKQVGGGGPGKPAGKAPLYDVTFERNQQAGLYAQRSLGGNKSKKTGGGKAGFGKAGGEVSLTHADRVTMRFSSKAGVVRAVRIMEGTAEAQTIRSAARAANPSVVLGNPLIGIKNFEGRFKKHPLGAVKDALDPVKDWQRLVRAGKTVLAGKVRDARNQTENPMHGGTGGSDPRGTIRVPTRTASGTQAGWRFPT